MIYLKHNKKVKVVSGIIILYGIAGLISSFDFSGRTSSVFCGLLTLCVVVVSWWMTIKAYVLAKKIERTDKWLCTCCCRDSAKQVLLGYVFIMGMLGTLKLWSVSDLFVDHWSILPLTYHMQSWAYLAHNAATVIMAYIILGVFEAKYRCAQRERVFVVEEELNCERHIL